MAVTTVVFDVGETLVDEARHAAVGAAGNMRFVREAFLHAHVDAVRVAAMLADVLP